MSKESKSSETTDPVIEKVVKALGKRKMIGMEAENAEYARELIFSIVPKDAVIGIGDSSSVRQVKAVTGLKERGHQVINGFDPEKKISNPILTTASGQCLRHLYAMYF